MGNTVSRFLVCLFLLYLLVFLLPPSSSSAQDVYLPGDCNGDMGVSLSDASYLLAFLFLGREAPSCLARCDSSGDGRLELSDASALIAFLYLGGPAPAGGVTTFCPTLDAVTIEWDPVTEDLQGNPEIVASYWVHYGTVSTRYDRKISVKRRNWTTLRALQRDAAYYVAVSAVDLAGNVGPLSEELIIPSRN